MPNDNYTILLIFINLDLPINQRSLYYKFFLAILFVYSIYANQSSYKWTESLPDPWTLSNEQLDLYLPRFHKMHPDYHDRLIALNLWRVGTPYGIFCLGEEQGVDSDPIIRFDTSDCTVHVLTTIALAESNSFQHAKDAMINIHYKPDQYGTSTPSYRSRWHFTSDRILNHPNTIDITSKISSPKNLETINIELNKKKNGSQFLDLGWTSVESIDYIPIEKLSDDMLSDLPSICGAAFVKKDYFKNGIVIAHEGYILNGKDLIHASSIEKKTVNVDLFSYLKKDDKAFRFDGIMFFDIRQRTK